MREEVKSYLELLGVEKFLAGMSRVERPVEGGGCKRIGGIIEAGNGGSGGRDSEGRVARPHAEQ